MTKRYLNSPEEVIAVLKEGEKVQTDYMEYWFSKGVFLSLNKKDGYVCINSNVLFIPDCMYVEESKPIKLEVGKFYKTRNGRKAWVIACQQSFHYPYIVAILGDPCSYTVLENGSFSEARTSPDDLVAPWEE